MDANPAHKFGTNQLLQLCYLLLLWICYLLSKFYSSMILNTPQTLAWLMDEQQGSLGFTEQELQQSAADDANPKVSAWKPPKYPDHEVSIAIDVARKEVVRQADTEIANFKAKLVEYKVAFPPTTPVQQSNHCLVENLMDYLFGPDSEMFWVFYKEIPIVQQHGHTLFTGCLSIFFQTSRFNISYSEVKSSQVAEETIGLPFTFHSAPGFPTLDQYNAFWKQVVYCGLPENSGRGTTERNPGWVSFWSMVQGALFNTHSWCSCFVDKFVRTPKTTSAITRLVFCSAYCIILEFCSNYCVVNATGSAWLLRGEC